MPIILRWSTKYVHFLLGVQYSLNVIQLWEWTWQKCVFIIHRLETNAMFYCHSEDWYKQKCRCVCQCIMVSHPFSKWLIKSRGFFSKYEYKRVQKDIPTRVQTTMKTTIPRATTALRGVQTTLQKEWKSDSFYREISLWYNSFNKVVPTP